MLTRLLHPQDKDLHEWEDSPESFHHEADVGSWEDHLRSCAETLFAAFLEVRYLSNPSTMRLAPCKTFDGEKLLQQGSDKHIASIDCMSLVWHCAE